MKPGRVMIVMKMMMKMLMMLRTSIHLVLTTRCGQGLRGVMGVRIRGGSSLTAEVCPSLPWGHLRWLGS